MAAITITDLNNAKQDVDHIAEVVNSSGATATDRLGNVKQTLADALSKVRSYLDRGEWATGVAYAAYDSVTVSGDRYLTITAHTAGATFAGDAASKWVLIGGAANVFQQAGAGATIKAMQDKARESKSAFDFMTSAQIADVKAGTVGIDVIAALRAGSSAILDSGGGTLKLSAGYYRVTDSWEIGLPEFDSYEFILSRTDALTDPDFALHRIPANVTANREKRGITIEFEENAFLVADFAPANLKPVLAYHLPGEYRKEGSLINPAVISKAMMTGTEYKFDSVATPRTNKLIGIYLARGARIVSKPFVSGCEHGIVSANGFWTHISDPRVEWAGGDCLNIAQGNAMTVENPVMWNSNRGLVFDGDASRVTGIHCQQVANELTVFRADCSAFGPGYLEDVSTDAGTGYAVTLGVTAGVSRLTSCNFEGIRVGARRPGKQSYRIWGALNGTFSGCRAYTGTVVYDTASYGSQSGCDFPVGATQSKFSVSVAGNVWPSFNMPSTSYAVQGPWMFAINGVAPSTIAAGGSYNHDYVLPAEMNSMNSGSACVTYVSGGNEKLVLTTRLLFTTPKKLRITWANNTAAGIDPGTMNLSATVFGGI